MPLDKLEIIQLIIKSEGGDVLVRDEDDHGGLTKYGVSQRSYPKLNIEALTEQDAINTYIRDFWDAIDCDNIPVHMQYMAMDCAVLQGEYFSKKEIRDICAITILTPFGQLMKFEVEREARFRKNPKFWKYGNGWLNRLNFVLSVCRNEIEPNPQYSNVKPIDIMPDFLKYNMMEDLKHES